MTLASAIQGMIARAMYSARITSANPTHTNEVFAGSVELIATDFDQTLQAEMEAFMEQRLPAVIEERGEEIKKSVLESPELGQMMGMMKGGPMGMVTQLLRFGGPLIVAALAPQMAEEVFKWLTRPGGWLDLRFKRVLENETNAFLDRQTQWNTQIGLRQVTIQSIAGFRNINGIGNENTLRQIREGGANGNRLALIDFTDHSKGLFD